MAEGTSKYKGDDPVNRSLLIQVARFVVDDELDYFAADLEVDESVYDGVSSAAQKKIKVSDKLQQ